MPDDDQAIGPGITSSKREVTTDLSAAIRQTPINRHSAERPRRLLTKNGEMIQLQLVEREDRETA